MKWASWVTFVLGLWLIVSPFAFKYTNVPPAGTLNDVIVGIVIAALSLWMAALYEPPVLISWIVALLGIWTVVASLVFRHVGQSPAATASGIAVGIVVFILALVRALGVGQALRESR